MGCVSSKKQHIEGLFNEDSDIRRKFLTGIQMSKGPEGIEGNFQFAFGKTKRKRYERVSDVKKLPKLEVEQLKTEGEQPELEEK